MNYEHYEFYINDPIFGTLSACSTRWDFSCLIGYVRSQALIVSRQFEKIGSPVHHTSRLLVESTWTAHELRPHNFIYRLLSMWLGMPLCTYSGKNTEMELIILN